MELNALLDTPVVLPSAPRTVALLMNELAQPVPSLRRMNLLWGTDPVLVARLLELANSQAFQMSGLIASIPQALALLGTAQLRTLVTSAQLGSTSRSVPGIDLQQFWRYSINTAKLARSLAGIVRQNQGAAYAAGLVHALGELAMHLVDPEKATAVSLVVPPLDIRRSKAEERIFGYAYGRVSAGLAQRWHWPQVLVEALEHQSSPFDKATYEPLAGILHLASWRACARRARLTEKEMAVTFPDEVGLALGLDIDMVLQQDPIDWTARRRALA